MNQNLRTFVTVPVLLGVVLVACGDDDSGLSEAEFREQANAIICEGDQEIGAAVGAVFGAGEPTPELMQEGLDTIVSSSLAQADAIDALEAPSDMADDVDVLLAEWRAAAAEAQGQGLGYFESDDDPWVTTTEMAADLGLESCGGE